MNSPRGKIGIKQTAYGRSFGEDEMLGNLKDGGWISCETWNSPRGLNFDSAQDEHYR
jgi:hypothetical protein